MANRRTGEDPWRSRGGEGQINFEPAVARKWLFSSILCFYIRFRTTFAILAPSLLFNPWLVVDRQIYERTGDCYDL